MPLSLHNMGENVNSFYLLLYLLGVQSFLFSLLDLLPTVSTEKQR